MEEEIEKSINFLKNNNYIIPEWCRLSPLEHNDGMGGCWGISGKHVEEKGKEYCKNCEYFKEGN